MNEDNLQDRGIGIKARYPNLPLSERLRGFLQLTRPFTLVAPMIVVIFGLIAQMSYAGELHLFWSRIDQILYVCFTLMIAQASGQVSNQACDPPELDRINGKGYRPIPSGVISQEEAISIAWIFGTFAIVRAFLTGTQFGMLVLAMMCSIIVYNFEPFRLKKRLWLNNLTMALSRGLLPFPAVWSVFGELYNPIPWVVGLCTFLWVLAWQSAKDIDDIKGDAEFGIMTPAVYYGVHKLKKLIVLPSLTSFILLAIFIDLGFIPYQLYLLLILIVPTLCMHKYFGKEKSIDQLENNIVWQLFYIVLGGWTILTAIALTFI